MGLKPEQRLKLNHPSSVLSAWKRMLAKPAAPKKPKLSLKVAWSAATSEERQKFLDAIGLNSILEAMPSSWRGLLADRIGGLQRSKQQSKRRTRLEKATIALQQALSLNESLRRRRDQWCRLRIDQWCRLRTRWVEKFTRSPRS